MNARAWSPYQQDIFADAAEGTGHSVVVARAGSGKTTTIVEALSHVPRGERSLLVAFNKSVEKELAKRAPRGVDVRTLHGYGFSVVRNAIRRCEVDHHKIDRLIDALFGAKPPKEQLGALRKGVSLAKATLASEPEQVLDLIDDYEIDVPVIQRPAFADRVLQLLDMSAEQTELVDFDDMIWLPLRLDLTPRAYPRIFVDELQDLNEGQIELALRACARGGRICGVGDDRQAIYGWRGAASDAVPGLIKRLRARVLPLSVTYRCARAIVDVAKRVVPDIEAAPGAELGSVEEVSPETCLEKAQPGDFILSRVNAPLVGMCIDLIAEGRPATVAGRDIGAGLAALIKRSRAGTCAELRSWVMEWAAAEADRLALVGRDPSGPWDKARCIQQLAAGAPSVAEVLERIDRLFADGEQVGRIVLSSTHRAKGLEAERVWVLAGTYRPRASVEEENLWYVAVTRAKRELRIVREAA